MFKISERTMDLLQNFASINPSIILQPGKVLRTISDSGTVIATAKIDEDFPHDFPIIDLGKLLSVMKLKNLKGCDVVFDENKLTLKGENVEQVFFKSASELVEVPADDLTLSSENFRAEVSAETLNEFIRACSALGHKTARLENKGGKSLLVATSPDLDNSNDYRVTLGETTLGDSTTPVDVANLKMVMDGYVITASNEDEMVMFESKDGLIKYVVGMMV